MPTRINLANQRFGRLLVIGCSENRSSSGDLYWKARCDCGSEREYRSKNLRSGEAASCGCRRHDDDYRRSRARDISGERFGRLVAQELEGFSSGGARWLCRCDCGSTRVVRANSLTTGRTISCGCYRPFRRRDLTGIRFGRLVAVESKGRRKSDALWRCTCDCGRSIEVIARSLVHGNTQSCGCAWQFRAGGKSLTSEYRATQEQKRRASKRNSGGSFSHAEVEALYQRQRGRCAVCRVKIPLRKMHRDHIVPLSAGGNSWISNIQLLCASCNCSKHARHSVTFMQTRGFLL